MLLWSHSLIVSNILNDYCVFCIINLFSRGAQKELYAFRGTEGFSTVLGQFDDVESEKIGAMIRILFGGPKIATEVACVSANMGITVSQLLNVIESSDIA